MKVQSLTGTVGYLSAVREKPDGNSRRQESLQESQDSQDLQDQSPKQHEQHERHEQSEQSEKNFSEEDSERLGQAVEDFQTEMKAKANGLSASLEGTGHGLKVILKDQRGQMVRQMSGLDFLKLRDSALLGSTASGKILDQKH